MCARAHILLIHVQGLIRTRTRTHAHTRTFQLFIKEAFYTQRLQHIKKNVSVCRKHSLSAPCFSRLGFRNHKLYAAVEVHNDLIDEFWKHVDVY